MKVQRQVDKIYTNLKQIPNPRGGQQLQSAIVIVDNNTGDIVGMAGGVGKKTGFDEWNRATDAMLQSGSSIKPLSIYAPGFEQGSITPATVVKDIPLTYKGGAWPKNDSRSYSYSRTILSAIVSSVNASAAHTLDKIGLSYGYDFAKNKFGLSTLEDEYIDRNGTVHTDNAFAPLAMGAQTWGVTVRDMATAFATFANKGVYRRARTFTKVYDSNGNLVIDNTQKQEQILSRKSVDYINYCLVRATKNGTGTNAYFSGTQLAGKTGSTADFKDRWYCGFTGYYTAAVWTGFDKPEVIRGISGNPAAQLFKKVMKPLHSGKSNISLYRSSKLKSVSVCLDSGLLATSACGKDARGISRIATAVVYSDDYPKKACNKHVTIELCSGGGTPTKWCEKFAEVDKSVKITEKSYLRMTTSEYNEAAKAVGRGLSKKYIDKKALLIGGEELDDKVCEVHTEEAWKTYLASQTTAPPETTAPAESVAPAGNSDPAA